MAGPSNRELSRYQKEIIGVVACSILVIFVLTPFTAKVLGPLSLVVVLAASLAPSCGAIGSCCMTTHTKN